MNTFAFKTKYNRKKAYLQILQKYQKYQTIGNTVKIIGMLILLIVSFILNIVYINLASTRGYFLRQANQKYSSTNFEYEIVKTQLMKVNQQNRELMKTLNTAQTTKQTKAETIQLIPQLSGNTSAN